MDDRNAVGGGVVGFLKRLEGEWVADVGSNYHVTCFYDGVWVFNLAFIVRGIKISKL